MSCESDAKSCGCDFFPVHVCDVLLCHHCICVHFRRTLESQVKRCCAQISHHIGLHRLSTAQIPHSHPLAAPGKTVREGVHRKRTRESSKLGNVSSFIESKDCCPSGYLKMAGKKRSLRPPRGRDGCNKLTWRNRRKSWIKFAWDALNVIVSRATNLFEEHKNRFGSWNLRRNH